MNLPRDIQPSPTSTVRQLETWLMPAKPAKGPACEAGKCACQPICEPQEIRVNAAILAARKAKEVRTARASTPPPAGHGWLCVACAQLQESNEPHCGYPVKLVEMRDLERDPVTGRVTAATSADQ